ncbi:MAG: amino acid adenylation domain-containing protein [Streptosporangiaceae bacterium]|jgi:amino acid adenylation domain-containing protein/thioester reductase-like protein
MTAEIFAQLAEADACTVVVNDQGQHAVWAAGAAVPPGWHRRSAVMSRSGCLAAIEAAWKDLAPASVRQGHGTADNGRLVHELFADQASLHPGTAAVVAGRGRVTYGELDESSSRLAHYLAEAGVAPEVLVGVHLERGIGVISAILAIMKAGGGYLPIDPSLPPERLNTICSQLRPAVVITAAADTFPYRDTRLVTLGGLAGDLARRPAAPPGAVRPHADNICYAIHTSGSTGDPKAVAVSYGSLACTIGDMAAEYGITREDRIAQVASLAFDTSLEQIFVALTCGASLILPPPGTMAPSGLLRGIQRRRVTVLDLTPAYWHRILALAVPGDERLRSVRLMITGGEQADPADCAAALRSAPWARLINAYGLTETGITSAAGDVGTALAAAPGTARIPVGKPAARARIMILDEKLDPVPAGAEGEICIGGRQVARGYIGRPALTAERFGPDPGGARGARMYRTGDLGRWLEDGSLEVAGRMDRQLKVHGFRVEPGEIESVLAGHPGVGQVSVAATGGPSGVRLVAYYTPRETTDGTTSHPSAASLRRWLLDRLPGYMVPAAFVPRRRMPSGPQVPGPRSGVRPASPDGHDERRTTMQASLAVLWAKMLKRDHVGLDDDFFALGGDSLLAAEMLAATQALFSIAPGSARPLTRCLLRDPTLRGFAAAAEDARAGRLTADSDQPEIDYAREARLDLAIRLGDTWPDWRNPREALLTGATGFLGAHLLRELIDATSARVWCLVRAGGEEEAFGRIARAAARYKLAAPQADRVVPLAGDLAEPRLGLPEAAFRDLARHIDVIYHAGAQVNFIYPYQELRAANVAGTREVIRLAGLYRAIPVHYVSTTAVIAGLGVAGVREVTEETPLAHPDRLRMGYVETKYVAEELLRNADKAGLPVAVYRPLDIVGSLETGTWSTATEMCALIRFIAGTGLAPAIDLPLDFVAADICAAAIRHISATQEMAGRTYHLASPRQASLSSLVGRLRDRGYRITEVPFGDWTRELARQAARDPFEPMAAFLPLFVDRDSDSGLTVAEMYLARVFPAYSRSNTEHALLGSGIVFPPVDGQLLDRNIDRLMETGYLPALPGRHRPAHAC